MIDLWVQLRDHYSPVLQLFWPSVVTGLAMALAGGSVGVVTLLRREALVALALPQVVLLGAAFGLRYLTMDPSAEPSPTVAWLIDHAGWPTLPGAVVAVVAALLLSAAARIGRGGSGPGASARLGLLPAIYVGATSVAVLIVFGAGNDLIDVKNRFVGIEIGVDEHLAEVSVIALLLCGGLALLLWRRWLLVAQSPALAEIAGVRPALWDALFLGLLAAVILVGTNALGAVLVLASLFLPAATVLPWCRRVPSAMAASSALSAVTYGIGFMVSNAPDYNWPLAHTVGALGVVLFLVSYLLSLLVR